MKIDLTPGRAPRLVSKNPERDLAVLRRMAAPPVMRRPMGSVNVVPERRPSMGSSFTREVAYSQYADLAIKTSLTLASVGALVAAESALEKILFGISTALTGAVTLASAYETL